ncbi:MAG: hypothetical protein NC177_04895 [Ruminococcus flavefaciens]|nr:hypothetical protein [Ruminococcus flavefaciens]
MNKTRKIEILHKMAKGESYNATSAEIAELKKYKVSRGEDSFCATKKNISDYITDVDNGCRISFYDWCRNHKRADRRRKGSSEKDISASNRSDSMSFMFVGWLTWGIAVYWIANGAVSVGACAIAGAVIAFVLSRCARRTSIMTMLILPIILASYFGRKNL